MTECYKLVFDLALYYTISGYFFMLIARVSPSSAAFVAMAAAVGTDALLRRLHFFEKRKRWLRYLPLLLPLLTLLFHPTFWQMIHFLPVWLYLGWSMVTDRVQTDYEGFRSRFFFGIKLLLLLVLGPMFPKQFSTALLHTIPYLIVMLAIGICLLRMLREDRPEGLRQAIYIAVFILLCALLTLGRAPQMLLKGIGYVYRGVIAPLILVAALLIAVLFYGFYILFAWLVALVRGSQPEPLTLDVQSAAEMFGLGDKYSEGSLDLSWLRTLLIILGVAVLLLLLFLIFRRLLGDREKTAPVSPWQEQTAELSQGKPGRKKVGILRPRDPRLAVRYYYAKFLSECRKRGVDIPCGITATELAERTADVFPGADPASLAALYRPARYSACSTITQSDVQQAAALWHSLRQSKLLPKK